MSQRRYTEDSFVAGFDPAGDGRTGKRGDATAIVALRIEDRFMRTYRVWAQPQGVQRWKAPRDEVEQAVRELFENPSCVGVRSDGAAGYAALLSELRGKHHADMWDDHVSVGGRYIQDARVKLVEALSAGQMTFDQEDRALADSLQGLEIKQDGSFHKATGAAQDDLADAASFAFLSYLVALENAPVRRGNRTVFI